MYNAQFLANCGKIYKHSVEFIQALFFIIVDNVEKIWMFSLKTGCFRHLKGNFTQFKRKIVD